MRVTLYSLYFLLYLIPTVCLPAQQSDGLALEKVTLQLKWFHQFQFAGYYAAKEQGYYAQEGLDVEILERQPTKDLVKQVVSGEVNFAVGDCGILNYYARGEPIIALAAIFQHNPLVFIAKKNSGIISPYEMQGKRIMFDSVGEGDAPLRAVLLDANLDNTRYQEIKHSFNNEDLINNKVDVMSAYLSNELFYFQQKKVKINIINPQNYGIDFYGDLLFTSQNQLKQYPEQVEKFRRASLKGWQYALEHPEEIVQLIHTQYHSKFSIEHLHFEAEQMRKLILPDIIPIGQIESRRLQKVAEVYTQLKLSRPLTENDLAKFIYVSQTLTFTAQEHAWLKTHPVIRLGIDKNFPPYEWIDEDGNYVGLVADYIALFERILGIKFQIIKDKPWTEILNMAQKGQLDMIAAAVETPERGQFLNFTQAYTNNSIIIVSDKNSGFIGSLSQLNNRRVVLEKGYFTQEILKRDYPQIKLILADDIKQALDLVTTGKADAYVGNALTAHYVIQELGLANLGFSGNTGYANPLSVAVVKQHPELLSIMKKVINAIPLNEQERINNHWQQIKISTGISTEKVIQYGLIIVGILILFILWNLRLRREITTRERIEQQLRTLTVAVEQSPTSIVITDLNGNLLYVNPKFTEVTGYSFEEVKDKNLNILQSGLTPDTVYQQLWNTLLQGEAWNGEFINRKKSGELYWEDVHIAPTKDENGTTTHYVGIKLDVTERKLAEEKMRVLFQLSPIGFALNDMETGAFLEINEAMYKNTGYSKQEFLALRYWDLTPRDYEAQEQNQLKLLEETGRYGSYEKEYIRKDGSRYPVMLNGMLMHDVTGRKLIWSIVEDISERKQAEEILRKSEQKYQSLVNDIGGNFVIYSHTLSGELLYVSDGILPVMGFTKEAVLGQNWATLFAWQTESLTQAYDYIAQFIQGKISFSDFEMKYRHPDATNRILRISAHPVRNETGEILTIDGIAEDITERKQVEEQIKQLAFYDPLTLLPNRRLLNDRLKHSIDICHRTNKKMAIFMMDLDRFKVVNDTLGHAAGDELLKQIAIRLKERLREMDTIARLGGDEFVILIEKFSSFQDLSHIAEIIIKTLSKSFTLYETYPVTIGISIGIAVYPDHGTTIEALLEHADMALYQAKNSGRSQFSYFSNTLINKNYH